MRNIAKHRIQRLLVHVQLIIVLVRKAVELAKIDERVIETPYQPTCLQQPWPERNAV